MKLCYIVMNDDGDSNYNCAVFDNKNLADDFVNRFGGRIEIKIMNLCAIDGESYKNKKIFYGVINIKGEIIRFEESNYFYIDCNFGFNRIDNELWCYVIAKNEEIAIKEIRNIKEYFVDNDMWNKL